MCYNFCGVLLYSLHPGPVAFLPPPGHTLNIIEAKASDIAVPLCDMRGGTGAGPKPRRSWGGLRKTARNTLPAGRVFCIKVYRSCQKPHRTRFLGG